MGETAQDRKVFPMGTFYSCLKGDMDAGVRDMLGYIAGVDIDSDSEIYAAALAKAWIYEQNPELIDIDAMGDMGQHVSLPQLPAEIAEKVAAIVTKVKEQAEELKAKTAKIADLEKQLADTAAKLKTADSKVTTYEAQLGEGEKKFQVSEGKVDGYIGKVDSLLAKIEEVIKHGVVSAAPGGEGAPAAAAGDAAAQDEPGAVADDFGFGTVQEDDSFGF